MTNELNKFQDKSKTSELRQTVLPRFSFKMKSRLLIGFLFLTLLSACRGLCPLVECDCNDDLLKVECVRMALKEIPITLNPHIATLKIKDSFLKRLDAALQFYPHLKVITTLAFVALF